MGLFLIRKGVLVKLREKVEEAVIPEGVTTIGECAFLNCVELTRVTLPSSLRVIGSNAFRGCSGLTCVTIPEGVTEIGDGAFFECRNLTSMTIPPSVTEIKDNTFNSCTGLTSVTIPDSVKAIGRSAFFCCSSLQRVAIPSGVTMIKYCTFYGCDSLKSVEIPEAVTAIGGSAFYCCTILENVTIPSGVRRIGECAFYHCLRLRSMTIPSNVSGIGPDAFSGCTGLESVTMLPGVEEIGSGAFSGCSGLQGVTIPPSVKAIGVRAFSKCSGLTSVTIPSGLHAIGCDVFSGCSGLTSVVIPQGVKVIELNAFSACTGLEHVTISSSVTWIDRFAFSYCRGLKSVTIPPNMADLSFLKTSEIETIRTIILEAGRTEQLKIGGAVLSELEEVRAEDIAVVPARLRPQAAVGFAESGRTGDDEHGRGYFKYIRKNAARLTENALRKPRLLHLMCEQRLIDAKAFDTMLAAASESKNTEATAELLMYRSVAFTQADMDRFAESRQRQMDEVMERAIDRAGTNGLQGLRVCAAGYLFCFKNRTALKRMLEEKGARLVTELTSKVDILLTNDPGDGSEKKRKAAEFGIETISDTEFIKRYQPLYDIEDGVLRKCWFDQGITEIEIPAHVKVIEEDAFYNRHGLNRVSYRGELADWIRIDARSTPLFREVQLYLNGEPLPEKLVIPDGAMQIGPYAFAEQKGLTSVAIPPSVTMIGDHAFWSCRGLKSVTIPSGVTTIGAGAFAYCTGLTNVTISAGVTQIGRDAFHGCTQLESITVPADVPDLSFLKMAEIRWIRSLVLAGRRTGVPKMGGAQLYGLREVHAEDPAMVPTRLRPLAAATFAGSGRPTDDVYGMKYLKYIREKARMLTDMAPEYPGLLRLMCKERLIDEWMYGRLCALANKSGDEEALAVLSAYQGSSPS